MCAKGTGCSPRRTQSAPRENKGDWDWGTALEGDRYRLKPKRKASPLKMKGVSYRIAKFGLA
jgi:hypothetical protein